MNMYSSSTVAAAHHPQAIGIDSRQKSVSSFQKLITRVVVNPHQPEWDSRCDIQGRGEEKKKWKEEEEVEEEGEAAD